MSNFREHAYVNASFASGATGATPFNVSQYLYGAIRLPTGFKGLKVFFAAAREHGSSETFNKVRTQAGVLVSSAIPASTGRGDWLPVPNEVMQIARGLQLVASSAQTAAKTADVCLKA